MAIISRIFSLLSLGFGAVLPIILVGVIASQAAEPEWPKGPYKYFSVDQDIRDVLAEFGRNLNLSTSISEAVEGRIRNSSAVLPAREFLQHICDSYGLVWYFDGAVLHISSENEVRTELINVSPSKPAELIQQIGALGMSDARYEVRPGTGADIISVSGPPPFLAIVKKTVSALKQDHMPIRIQESPGTDVLKVRVFRGGR